VPDKNTESVTSLIKHKIIFPQQSRTIKDGVQLLNLACKTMSFRQYLGLVMQFIQNNVLLTFSRKYKQSAINN
jgi:hypothetical protein